ncbi:hypothetical protein KAI78_04665 [bacterium]|nr:hypothetical protein [bacterium]
MRKYLLIIVFLSVFFLGCQEHTELTTPEESFYRFNTSSEYSLHYSEFSDMIDIIESDGNGYIIFLYETAPCQTQISVNHERIENPFLQVDKGIEHDREYIPVDPKFFSFLERMSTFIELAWVEFDTTGHSKAYLHKISVVSHLISQRQFNPALHQLDQLYRNIEWIQSPEFERIFKMYIEATYWMVENPEGNLYLPQSILICGCYDGISRDVFVNISDLCAGWGITDSGECLGKCEEIYGDEVECIQGSVDTSGDLNCEEVCTKS